MKLFMSKGIKIHFNTLFVILLAVMSLNACQKRIATTNGQVLYDPNEEAYSYAGQTSGTQAHQYQQRNKKSKTYQRQPQEIMDLYNKNPNINPDSSKNVDENYYYAEQVSSKQDQNNTKQQEDNYYYAGQTNGNVKTKTSTANKNKQDNKADNNKQNNTNVVAPVILNNSKNKQPTNAIDKLNQPTKSADGKYTYVPNAQKAGIKNTNTDNVITDRELNDKLYGSMDGRFKKSKLEKVNKQNGLYSNKKEIMSGNTNGVSTNSTSTSTKGASSSGSSGGSSSWLSGDSVDLPDLNGSSFNSPVSMNGGSGLASSASSSASSSAASSALSSADKASLGTSIGTGSASMGASGASLASNLLGKGTPDLLGKSGSDALGKGKDISQNAKNKAKLISEGFTGAFFTNK